MDEENKTTDQKDEARKQTELFFEERLGQLLRVDKFKYGWWSILAIAVCLMAVCIFLSDFIEKKREQNLSQQIVNAIIQTGRKVTEKVEVKEAEKAAKSPANEEAGLKYEEKPDQNKPTQLSQPAQKRNDSGFSEKGEIENSSDIEESANSDTSDLRAFGIKIGKTTLKEIKEKFKIIGKEKDNSGYDSYVLNCKDFRLDGISAGYVDVTVNEQGTAEWLYVAYEGKHFKKLNSALAEKYRKVFCEQPFVGDCKSEYSSGDGFVLLEEPHLGFKTYLSYITANMRKKRAETAKANEEQKKKQLEDNL